MNVSFKEQIGKLPAWSLHGQVSCDTRYHCSSLKLQTVEAKTIHKTPMELLLRQGFLLVKFPRGTLLHALYKV